MIILYIIIGYLAFVGLNMFLCMLKVFLKKDIDEEDTIQITVKVYNSTLFAGPAGTILIIITFFK